jgi:putative phosphoribosyl transferase
VHLFTSFDDVLRCLPLRACYDLAMFTDRREAGERLVRPLAKYRGQRPLVAAIPRGAVVPGHAIAGALGGDLDVVFVRKLRAPGCDEVAVGAVDERGKVYVASHAVAASADDAWLGREAALQLKTIRAQRAAYTPHRPPLDPRERVVIVVDDGLATGMTMTAALRAVRARGAPWVVCAVAVASPAGLERVRPFADDVVCLAAPDDFAGVSLYYDDFTPVTDADAIRLLRPVRSAIA